MRPTSTTTTARARPPVRPARSLPARARARRAVVAGAVLALLGCTTRDARPAAGGRDTTVLAAPLDSAPTAPARPSGVTPVRGRLASLSDTALTVASAGGDVRVALAPPVTVYERVPADLSRVTEHSFVGVTSVAQPDGSQRATEIHVFPEQLRGTGEGSYLMSQAQGGAGGGGRSTMTNGTVAGARAGGGAPRMTNGTVGGGGGAAGGGASGGRTLTVQYGGGSQAIAIPADVPVTAIVPSSTPLRVGANVVVLAAKQTDGSLRSSAVMMVGDAGGARK